MFAGTQGRVSSSSTSITWRYGRPVARVMPISHVRFAETNASKPPRALSASAISADSWAVALAVSSGCSMPRSPAKAQQPQPSGMNTSSATAPAIAVSAPVAPSAVVEQVGCTATVGSFADTLSRGSTSRATNVVASSMRSPA